VREVKAGEKPALLFHQPGEWPNRVSNRLRALPLAVRERPGRRHALRGAVIGSVAAAIMREA
jgi:hypothetical protein